MIILAGGLTLLVITPWTIRNHNVHGRLVPIKDSFPKELWYGNNPDATGTPFLRGGATPIDLPEIWHEMYGKASEIQMMDAIAEKAWEYVRSDPAAFVRRTLTKILWFWTAVPRSLLRVTGEGEAVRFYWLHTGYWAAFLLAAALAVGWMKIRIPPLHAAALSAVILVYSAVYGLTIVGNARFRGEIEFIFIPLVSAFLAGVARGPFGGSQDRVRGAEAVTKSI
jgi:hypothetical protein